MCLWWNGEKFSQKKKKDLPTGQILRGRKKPTNPLTGEFVGGGGGSGSIVVVLYLCTTNQIDSIADGSWLSAPPFSQLFHVNTRKNNSFMFEIWVHSTEKWLVRVNNYRLRKCEQRREAFTLQMKFHMDERVFSTIWAQSYDKISDNNNNPDGNDEYNNKKSTPSEITLCDTRVQVHFISFCCA